MKKRTRSLCIAMVIIVTMVGSIGCSSKSEPAKNVNVEKQKEEIIEIDENAKEDLLFLGEVQKSSIPSKKRFLKFYELNTKLLDGNDDDSHDQTLYEAMKALVELKILAEESLVKLNEIEAKTEIQQNILNKAYDKAEDELAYAKLNIKIYV